MTNDSPNPIFSPQVYSLRELRAMKEKIIRNGINSWTHQKYSLICQLINMIDGDGT